MNRHPRRVPTRRSYGQRSRFGLAWQLRLLAVLLLLLGGVFLCLAAAAWLEGVVSARYQRIEQIAE